MMIRNAFSNDASCSWHEFNLHDNASIYVVYVESYYDGKKYITENKTMFYQAKKHLLIIIYYGIRATKSFSEK